MPRDATASPPSPLRPGDVARRAGDAWMAAFRERDADALAAVYAQDACVTSGQGGACGRAAIAAAARAVWSKLPDVKAAWGRMWVAGDRLAVESAWSADARGAVSLALCDVSPEGLVRAERVFTDARPLWTDAAMAPLRGRPFDGLPTTRQVYERRAEEPAVPDDVGRSIFASPSLAEDAELVDFAQPGSLVGKRHAERWTVARVAGLAGATATPTRWFAVESFIVSEYEVKGASKTGVRSEPARRSGAEVVEMEGGRVKRAWRYDDGPWPAPPSSVPTFPLVVP